MEIQVRPLLKLSAIDAPPKFLQLLQDAGKFVKKLRESDSDVVLSSANRSGSEEEHRALQAGLLYLALTEPDRRRSFCTDIVLTSRDNLTYVLSEITRLVAETWPKMSQNVRANLLTLLGELIVARASVEVLLLHIYRRMSSGDLSQSNLWLIENVVDLLDKNKEWLGSTERQGFLLPLTVFTLLRLIPDHHAASPGSVVSQSTTSTSTCSISVCSLRHRELVLAEELIRKHFDRCAQIGRDFVRLLHGIARLEPMRHLWDDMLQNMPSLSSHFTSLAEILEITTPQCFTQTLIPHEMEQWARWMMKNVHCVPRVPVNRYQDFFQRKFFSTPESQSLRVCLLRYIVTYFYPDNEMLASTLIPRWNVISWILSQSTCAVVTANAKLALFYDWLFFKPNDCIMNLEPALLAMMNHLAPRTQPIALSLVDFLIKIVSNYHPPMTDRIITGVRGGLEEMIRLGVVKNINPLFEMLHRVSPDLLRGLRTLLGCEPLPMGAPVPELNPRLSVSDRLDLTDDTSLTSLPTTSIPSQTIPTNVSSVANTGGVRRPSTPPLMSGKLKQPVAEGGSLTDPRLTRGHAAVLAGAVPNVIPPVQVETNMKPTSPIPEVTSSPVAVHPCPTGQTQPPPQLSVPSVISTMPVVVLVDELKSKKVSSNRQVPSLPLADALPVKPIQQASTDPVLSDLDRLDVDYMCEDHVRVTRGSWSPPPLPPSQTVYRSGVDDLSDSPESLELTIDNLRRRFQEYQLRYHYSVEPVDVNTLIEQLDGPIRTALEGFRDLAIRVELVRNTNSVVCADRVADEVENVTLNGGWSEKRKHAVRLRSAPVLGDLCDAMEVLIQAVLAEDCFDDLEIAGRTAGVVCELLFPLFAERLMPSGAEWSEEQLEDCLAFPIFVPFRHLWQMNPGDPKRELLLLLLTEMQARQPRLGYHLLFFLKVGKLNDETMTIYRNFCASQENPNLRNSLFKDMQLLADDNRRLFAYLLPDVYTVFATELINDVGFLHLVVSTIDPGMCNTVICEIVRGHLNMFRSSDITPVLKASLQWNSIEQYFFWQLINAHEIPTRSFLPLVKFVDPTKHPEACANLVLLFKLEKPSFELVRALLSRPGPNDALSITALHFWSCPDNQHASRFASILKSMIMMPLSQRLDSTVNSSGATSTSGNARDPREKKRNGTKLHLSPENHVDLSLILTHLDAIRRNCKNISHAVQDGSKMCNCFLQDEDVQLALQEVMKSNKVSVAVKDHFSDLLALAEDQPSAPQVSRTGNSATANGSTADPLRRRLTDRSLTTDSNKAVSFPARSVPLGSKGGHSLRNLDSRRAAQAERRQIPNSSSGASTVKQGSRASTSQNANDHAESDSSEDADAISLVSSSSDGLDEDEESERSTVTSKRNSRNSSPSGSRISHDPIAKSVKRGGRAPADLTKERRASTKRAPIRTESVSKVDADEEEDDDDEDEEDKGLEVVVLEDDSGDEKVNEDAEQVRPPKRRKTTSRRFVLDD